MTLYDLLRRLRYEVVERSGSEIVKRGEIIYCATTSVDGFRSNIGTGPYALRPIAKRDVLDLRNWMLEQSDNSEITTEHLHEFEYDIRGLYLHLLESLLLLYKSHAEVSADNLFKPNIPSLRRDLGMD